VTRHIVIASLVVLAVFGLGLALRNALFSDAGNPVLIPAVAPAQAVARPTQLTVRRVEGLVERRPADGESWQPLTPNASLSERDSVRTDEGAKAVLAAEDGLEIEVTEQSQLELLELQPAQAKVVVDRGRIAAAVKQGGAGLNVGSRDSDAIVEAKQGAFSVLRDGRGKLTVAVTDGDVGVTAQATRVQVAAGEQSVIAPNQAPAKPVRIPPSLFLKVSRSGPSRVNQHSTELAGVTSPGAAVYVNGAAVDTDHTGTFLAKVSLQEGKNALNVTVRDALGRVERAELPEVTVDTEPPKLKGKTVW
jgi:hypothetical protein